MVKEYQGAVTLQLYLGSGREGQKIRENIIKLAGEESIASFLMKMLKKADPKIFKGVQDGKD